MCLKLYKFSFPGPKGRKRWFHMRFMAVHHSFTILWERGEGGNLYSSDTGVSICSTQVADLVWQAPKYFNTVTETNTNHKRETIETTGSHF